MKKLTFLLLNFWNMAEVDRYFHDVVLPKTDRFVRSVLSRHIFVGGRFYAIGFVLFLVLFNKIFF